MATVSVRYIVDDVDAAIAFYCGDLGFTRGDASGACGSPCCAVGTCG